MSTGTLILDDCLSALARVAPGSVDMVLADLPYGTTQNKWDSVIPFDQLWPLLLRACKPNAALVFTASQPFTSALVMSQPKLFRHEWIWHKTVGTNFLSTGNQPLKEHESVLVFCRGGWVYNGQKQERIGSGKNRIGSVERQAPSGANFNPSAAGHMRPPRPELRVPSSVQRFTNQRGLHPTQKPVALFEYLIRTYTDPGDVVLDPTSGSGTTAVAAHNTGRHWVCIERNEKYFETTRTRLAELSAAPRLIGALA